MSIDVQVRHDMIKKGSHTFPQRVDGLDVRGGQIPHSWETILQQKSIHSDITTLKNHTDASIHLR
jgi:hypothetical protein